MFLYEMKNILIFAKRHIGDEIELIQGENETNIGKTKKFSLGRGDL